ncbi:hypothetical protein GPECTOR_15g353 [Gonium pectorale]|uniref:Protein kinase domain-containing protein n=1 Tax=Gonium pectorale TaxID=33097 RepID=A0A150GLD8_GONPE|nr:hypothetical protein GPECTOR_15g353 [Gonium pectorale]|eukprot:KXZ50669.1 hypothetical protein GPECTOR_15g353 [Gonium pectorale]
MLALQPGQQLKLTALSLYLKDIDEPLGPLWSLSLPFLAPPAPFRVPNGATLVLEDVMLVVARRELQAIFTALCSSTDAWPYTSGVSMLNGSIAISSFDSRARGPDGSLGGGGEVRWRNVTITCPDDTVLPNPKPGLQMPYPCSAAAVAGGSAGGLRTLSADMLRSTQGLVSVALASNMTLAPSSGRYWPVTLPAGQGQLVLRGDPNSSTTLDLAGREDAWEWLRSAGGSPSAASPTVVYLRDLTLVNLPYSAHPSSPADLLAVSALSFAVSPGDWPGPWVRLTRCTLVLPDEELAFLEGVAARNTSGTETGLFNISLQASRSGYTPTALLVLLLNCTLLSASAYAALPGSMELLPQSRVWPPLLLHGDEETALELGPAGLWLAPGLQEALADQDRVRNDNSTSLRGTNGSSVVAGGKEGPGSEDTGVVCTISGYAPELVGGRTFTDLKGMAGGFQLRRPVSLRNLVLYNLAPGGINGTAGGLEGPDAPWGNSTLPLWHFSYDSSVRAPALAPVPTEAAHVPGTTGSALPPGSACTAFTAAGSPSAPASAAVLEYDPGEPALVRLSFKGARASKVRSYDPSSGTLVLSVARHYGWTGADVTITHQLPVDAPPGAQLMPFNGLVLPYKELAGAVHGAAGGAQPVAVASSGGGAPAAPVDDQTFLQDVSVYFDALRGKLMRKAEEADSVQRSSEASTRSVPLTQRPGTHRDLSRAIRVLQAELGGAELKVMAALGSGAYGVVYRGMWRGLDVAVKTIIVSEAHAAETGARQRVVLEAAISMAMSHPNIVGNSATGMKVGPAKEDKKVSVEIRDAYKLYIVQELCNGGTLHSAIRQGMAGSVCSGGPRGLLALRLALGVAQGMQHIHGSRIVHGDLKPENVLLVCHPATGGPRGAPGSGSVDGVEDAKPQTPPESGLPQLTAKVADFGLSLPLPEGATHASKLWQGTPARSAPEVFMGGRQSPRADVWSFGIMLIELFYGCALEDIAAVYASLLGPEGGDSSVARLCLELIEDMLESPHRTYAELVAACLSVEAHDRPGFDVIVRKLEELCSCAKHGNTAPVTQD